MLNKLFFEGLLKEGDLTNPSLKGGQEGDFLAVLLEVLNGQVQAQGVYLEGYPEKNLLPEELLSLLSQRETLPQEALGEENQIPQELAPEGDFSDKEKVEKDQPDPLRLIASLKVFLPNLEKEVPAEISQADEVTETYDKNSVSGQEKLSELLKILLASREFTPRAENPTSQLGEPPQKEDTQQVNFISYKKEENLQVPAKPPVSQEVLTLQPQNGEGEPQETSELLSQVEKVPKGQERLRSVPDGVADNPVNAEVGKDQQKPAFSEKAERVEKSVNNSGFVHQKQENLPKDLRAKLETAVNPNSEEKKVPRADLKQEAVEGAKNPKESLQKGNVSLEPSISSKQREVRKETLNTASPAVNNSERKENPKVENIRFEAKDTRKADVPKADSPVHDDLRIERNLREVKEQRITIEQGRVSSIPQEAKGKEAVEPKAERPQGNYPLPNRVEPEPENPQSLQKASQQTLRPFGQVKDGSEVSLASEGKKLDDGGTEKVTAKGGVKPEENRTVGFDFSQNPRNDVEAEEVQQIQRKEPPLPEQRQTTKNLSLRFEDVNLRFKFQSNYLSVDVRSQENLENKLSYLDVQRLAKSLEGLGLSLSALRVNGTEFTPKNPKYSKREERQRFNIRENERVAEETFNTGADSVNINLLL